MVERMVLGLQRAATNFLDEVLTQNFRVHIDAPFWKHALPQEVADLERQLASYPAFLISKSPYSWTVSIDRGAMDLWGTRSEGSQALAPVGRVKHFDQGPYRLEQAIRLYNDFYRQWLERCAWHIGYESMLRDFAAFLDSVPLERSSTAPRNPVQVHASRAFTDEQIQHYMVSQHGLDRAKIDEINEALDMDLMQRLGYAIL